MPDDEGFEEEAGRRWRRGARGGCARGSRRADGRCERAWHWAPVSLRIATTGLAACTIFILLLHLPRWSLLPSSVLFISLQHILLRLLLCFARMAGQFSFPSMSVPEIVDAFTGWGFSISNEQVAHPTTDFVMCIYCACLEQVTGITPSILQPCVDSALESAENKV